MTLRERLIKEIDRMSPAELLLVQSLARALRRRGRAPKKRLGGGYLQARKALEACQGNLSDSIIDDRDDRI